MPELLSNRIRPLWEIARKLGSPTGHVQGDAVMLVMQLRRDLLPLDPGLTAEEFHVRMLGSDGGPPIITHEDLALGSVATSCRKRLTVHALRPQVCALIDGTDLHSVPHEAPRLLRGGWIFEAQAIGSGGRLFGDTVGLCGYAIEERICFFGITMTGHEIVAPWRPRWGGEDLAVGHLPLKSGSLGEIAQHQEWAEQAARFATVFGVLLDAQGAPFQFEDEVGRAPRGAPADERDTAKAWVMRHVRLTSRENDRHPTGRSGGGDGIGTSVAGRELAEVSVSGHVKRQPYGPGGSQRRYIYVEGYEARRWVAPAARAVVT